MLLWTDYHQECEIWSKAVVERRAFLRILKVEWGDGASSTYSVPAGVGNYSVTIYHKYAPVAEGEIVIHGVWPFMTEYRPRRRHARRARRHLVRSAPRSAALGSKPDTTMNCLPSGGATGAEAFASFAVVKTP